MPDPPIVLYREDRLCARLRHMLSGWHIARRADKPLVMLWPERPPNLRVASDGPYDPGLIFDWVPFLAGPLRNTLSVNYGEFVLPKMHKSGLGFEGPLLDVEAVRGLDRAVLTQGLLGYRYQDEAPSDVEVAMRELFSQLPVRNDVSDEVDSILSKAGLGSYTVVHVRRGDIPESIRRESSGQTDLSSPELLRYLKYYVTRSAPMVVFESAIEESLSRGAQTVVTSDDAAAVESLRSTFGTRVVFLSDHSRGGPEIRRAFIDFSIVAHAQTIIGCRGSGYVSFAATVSGRRLNDVVAMGSPEERVADVTGMLSHPSAEFADAVASAVYTAYCRARAIARRNQRGA